MGTGSQEQPGRAQPNESENQPGYEPEDESQRQSQGDVDDPSKRQAGFDDQRKDEVSAPPAGTEEAEEESEPKKY